MKWINVVFLMIAVVLFFLWLVGPDKFGLEDDLSSIHTLVLSILVAINCFVLTYREKRKK